MKPKVNIDNRWLQQADPEGRYAAPDDHRRTSKIKEDYPVHDAGFVSRQKQQADSVAHASRMSSSVHPPSFAWKLQDPNAANEGLLYFTVTIALTLDDCLAVLNLLFFPTHHGVICLGG